MVIIFGNVLKKKRSVFDRKELLKAIEKMKEARSGCDRISTDLERSEAQRAEYKELSEAYTQAINAMECILYDL